MRRSLSLPALATSVTLLVPAAAHAQMPGQSFPALPPVSAAQTATGFHATIGEENLDVTVCSAKIVHVVARPSAGVVTHAQPWLLPAAESCKGAPFTFSDDGKLVTLKTGDLIVTLAHDRGNLNFANGNGDTLLSESGSIPRTYEAMTINGEPTLHTVDRFSPKDTEAIYGLGQHQSGMFNYRGATVELAQNNTDIAIPFLMSSRGYGVLWNTASLTYVDNRFPLELKFDSMAGQGVDYFVIAGPEMDQIVHGYRSLTGHAPMLPRWSYGFIQSKDRYTSLDEIEAVGKRYRDEHIPIDTLVQDWFWWKTEGDPVFNANYHDVAADLKKLHDQHFHTMISTWGLLDPRSQTFARMQQAGVLLKDAEVYDPSTAAARKLYWKSLPGPLFAQGWDSFWLDSAEPEEYWPHMGDAILKSRTLGIGNGAEYTNVFPLLHNEGIQDNWRATSDTKRTFLLTRSAFLGQQRVGGTVWSGDVYGNYWGLKHQIAGGLNYALSGLPYWTTDIGGYWPTTDYPLDTAAYQELYLRWFQFGTFCPVFRSHGHRPHNEIWTYDKVEPALIAFDKLRYRLMPYIYSLAAMVSQQDYTIMRPLVMDFRSDPRTHNINDQFLFGPAIMVNPVTEPGATSRTVYLPQNTIWYDFWTGKQIGGGVFLNAAAPLDKLPLLVRAGSIVPMGPVEQYADEKPNGPIELRIYPGADGGFTLYNDEGDNRDYEKGKSSNIRIAWSNSDRVLTLGARQGAYPGMPHDLTFKIVIVRDGHGAGPAEETGPDRTVTYRGNELRVPIQ